MIRLGDLVRKADEIEYWKKQGIRTFITESGRLGLVVKVNPWGCTVRWNDGEQLVYRAEQLEVVS